MRLLGNFALCSLSSPTVNYSEQKALGSIIRNLLSIMLVWSEGGISSSMFMSVILEIFTPNLLLKTGVEAGWMVLILTLFKCHCSFSVR